MHLSPAAWLARLPTADGARSVLAFERGTLTVKFSAPRGSNEQQPHERDEVYVVVSGSGAFVHGRRREPFQAGDLLFVPAGLDHRFEEFTNDLAVWVLFYGPPGGERPGAVAGARLTTEEWLPTLGTTRFTVAFEHGTLSVELYAPRGRDPQQPHARDEVYVVVRGSGAFVSGDSRGTFRDGDLLFVPAGVVHRFEDFTEDLMVWVVFYG